MATQQLARVQIRFTNDPETSTLDIWLNGGYQRFTGGSDFFRINNGDGTFSQSGTAVSVASGISNRLISIGADTKYTVSTGTYIITTPGTPPTDTEFTEVIIEATSVDSAYDFEPTVIANVGGANFWEQNRLDTVYPIIITPAVSQVVCYGSSTGSITLAVSGGVGEPYTYLWNDGATTKDRTNLPVGSYAVTVTDSQGFTATVNIPVTQNSEIQVVGTVVNDAITLEVTGGTAPYTYLWSTGATTKDITGVTPGDYTVTVTDSNGCSKVFNITVADERFYFSKDPVLLELQALNTAAKPNLSFLCEVWVEKDYLSEQFERVAELEHPADQDGSTTFDVKDFLQDYVKPHFPEYGQTAVTMAGNAFKRFYLRYTQKYGTSPVPETFTIKEIRYALWGGLDFEEQARGTFFSSYLLNQKPFFSWLPQSRKVRSDQPEYLYFMLTDLADTSFKVQARVYYSDATSEVKEVFDVTGARRFELYCIPAGHDLLNLATAGKTVVKYELWCSDAQGVMLSELRTFEIDTQPSFALRYFLYANSIGGVNTLAATGKAALAAAVKAESIERVLNAGYNPEDGDTQTVDVVAEPVLKLSTGYVASKAEFQALQDFALSHEVRLYGDGRYQAGSKEVRSMEVFDETSQLQVLDFEFKRPMMRRYTPKL